MKEKDIILAARIISMVFTPFYLPIVGLLALFLFTYMSILPWSYKLWVLLLAYLFTVLLPTLLIHLYRRYQGWSRLEIATKERRMIPYIIAILCYFLCYYIMSLQRLPQFMADILMVALMIQMVCAVINVWWKISTHTAAIGGVEGALMAFAFLFDFNPLWWFCITLIVAGMVGSARMILRQHTLSQVLVGFFVGLITSFWIII
ncbi:MAG: hypothetical protein ACOYJF_05325 [Prevotella sp.]